MSHEDTNPSAVRQHAVPTWARLLAGGNFLGGVALWFFFASEYSLPGTIPDLVFGPAVGILAILSLVVLSASRVTRNWPAGKVALLPGLIGGGLALLLAVGMWLPPFTLGALFYVDEVTHEKVIQRAVSPDGNAIAIVRFRGVGAYDRGNGRVSVEVSDRRLPFLEREAYYNGTSYADETTRVYVRWRDSRSLQVVGEPDRPPLSVPVNWLPS